MLQRECVDGIHERNIEFGIKRIDSYYDISLKTKNILKLLDSSNIPFAINKFFLFMLFLTTSTGLEEYLLYFNWYHDEKRYF